MKDRRIACSSNRLSKGLNARTIGLSLKEMGRMKPSHVLQSSKRKAATVSLGAKHRKRQRFSSLIRSEDEISTGSTSDTEWKSSKTHNGPPKDNGRRAMKARLLHLRLSGRQ